MEIPFQLKMGDLNKAGFAPIQLTVSWDGQQVRERTRPELFEVGRVRAVKDSYFADINARLTDLQTALERAQQDADNERRLLSEDQVREAIACAVPAARAALAGPTNTLAGLPVLELVKQWMVEEAVTVSKKTGRVKAKNTMSSINGTYEKLRKFEEASGEPLDLIQMDLLGFYNPFRIWFMDDIG